MIEAPTNHPWTERDGVGPHVLIATRWYPGFDAPGRGIFVADQAAAVAAAGAQVSVVVWDAAYARGVHAPAARSGAGPWLDAIVARGRPSAPLGWGAPGIPVARLPAVITSSPPSDPLAPADRQSEALLRFGLGLTERHRIDLVHAHTGMPDGIASIALADRLGVPLVVTEHDSSLPARLQDETVRTAYRRLVGPGRCLVAVSETVRRSLADALGVAAGDIHVVPNVVAVDAFRPVGPEARDPGELLWVGGRKASKGTDVLLAAFRELLAETPSLRLRLIGRAPGEAEETRLRNLARDLGVADAVTFEPAVDRAGIAAAMERAAVFVHPSPFETFGVVAAEALAAGLPVAATPSGGVPEILGGDGAYGVVAAGTDAAALAAAVREVLGRRADFDPDRLRARVVERYAPTAVARRLVDLYAVASAGPAATSVGPPARRRTPPGSSPPAAGTEPAADAGRLPLVVGLHRASAHARLGGVPDALAAEILAVTSTQRPTAADSAPVGASRWIEIDTDRGYRDARARAGGALPPRTGVRRVLRAIRHPIRILRLRRLAARRDELVLLSVRNALRDVLAALVTDGQPIEILPLDVDDVVLVEPFLDDRVRLYPSTLRGLVDRWDAAGRPSMPSVSLPPAGGAYDPARYWTQLHRRQDLSAVGQAGLPPEINAWLYRALARNFRGFLRRHGLDRPAPERAFDVGIGIGYWVRFWRSLGVRRVDGCDLVAEAVAGVEREATAAGAEGSFVVADIGVVGALPAATYPIVSCLNVLLHVVDEDAFDRALANIAALVEPGGALILAEPILLDGAYEVANDGTRHSSARTLARYRTPLEAAGLELVDVRPATVLANNPMEARSRPAHARYLRWWRFVASRSRADARSARWLGPLVLGLDRVAMLTGQAPSTKFALFRRPAPEPGQVDVP